MAEVVKLDQGIIFVNENSCKKMTENCAEMGKLNASILRPFLKAAEILTRCSVDGELSDVDESLVWAMEGKFTEAGDYERAEGESVDGVVCGKLGTFGGSVNPHAEGDALYLKKLYQRS
jgi:hypothetical protein